MYHLPSRQKDLTPISNPLRSTLPDLASHRKRPLVRFRYVVSTPSCAAGAISGQKNTQLQSQQTHLSPHSLARFKSVASTLPVSVSTDLDYWHPPANPENEDAKGDARVKSTRRAARQLLIHCVGTWRCTTRRGARQLYFCYVAMCTGQLQCTKPAGTRSIAHLLSKQCVRTCRHTAGYARPLISIALRLRECCR